jgi:hypothetical protein
MNPEWIEQQLLDILNSFVEMVTQTDTPEAIYFDPTTGDLPWLATTALTYQYNLPSNLYKARNIVVAATKNNNSTQSFVNNPYYANNPTNEFVHPKATIYLGSMEYLPVPAVIQPAYGSNPATVIFRFDPKTTTNTYQIYGYNNSSSTISSLSSTLPIETKFHLEVVVPACQLIIDGLDNGNFVEIMPAVKALANKIMIQKYYNTNDDVNVEPMDL